MTGLHLRAVSVFLDMLLDPSWVSFWAAIAALGAIGQVVVLIVTACFVWRYLKETERLRIAALQQVAAADKQLEAQIRPALVVRVRGAPESLLLVNVGKGPAFDVILSQADRGREASRQWSALHAYDVDIGFVAAGGEMPTGIRTRAQAGVGGEVLAAGNSLQCEYTSLSGLTYWTMIGFDAAGNAVSTRFNTEQDLDQ